MPPRIHGEYDFVTWVSRDPAALARVHGTPCTRDEAVHIIRTIAPQLNIRVLFNGSKGLSTRVGIDSAKRRISLPAQPGRGAGKLRVGLVLHELAHQLAPLRAGHGAAFVEVLDGLIQWWVARQAALEAHLFVEEETTNA